MIQVIQREMVKIGSIMAILGLTATSSIASELQDIYSYQSTSGALEADFIQSNIEGLFEGQKLQKNFSEKFSFEMVHLKSAHKAFDVSHRNILETSTHFDFIFSDQWVSKIALGNSREDISNFGQEAAFNSNKQSVYSFTQSWRKILGENTKIETYLGIVQASTKDLGQEKYYPVLGLKFQKTFENHAEIRIHAAQEIQNGGSYTGMYGNQIFRKLMVMGKIPLFKKLSLLWDAGIGISQGSFEEKGFSIAAGVATGSASLQYDFGKNVKGTFGYSYRSLMEEDRFGTEGHMMSASLSFASF